MKATAPLSPEAPIVDAKETAAIAKWSRCSMVPALCGAVEGESAASLAQALWSLFRPIRRHWFSEITYGSDRYCSPRGSHKVLPPVTLAK